MEEARVLARIVDAAIGECQWSDVRIAKWFNALVQRLEQLYHDMKAAIRQLSPKDLEGEALKDKVTREGLKYLLLGQWLLHDRQVKTVKPCRNLQHDSNHVTITKLRDTNLKRRNGVQWASRYPISLCRTRPISATSTQVNHRVRPMKKQRMNAKYK